MPKLAKTQLKELEEQVFADVYHETKSPSKAMIAIQPNLKDKPEYAKVKAQRMLKRPEVQDKIQSKLEKLSKKAMKNIDSTLTSDNEVLANNNAWRIVEHLRGKPVARNISLNANASVEDVLSSM